MEGPPKKKSKTQCCFECNEYRPLRDDLCIVCETKYITIIYTRLAEEYFANANANANANVK